MVLIWYLGLNIAHTISNAKQHPEVINMSRSYRLINGQTCTALDQQATLRRGFSF